MNRNSCSSDPGEIAELKAALGVRMLVDENRGCISRRRC